MRCYPSDPLQFIASGGRLTLQRGSWPRRTQLRFVSPRGSQRRLEPERQPWSTWEKRETNDSVNTEDEER